MAASLQTGRPSGTLKGQSCSKHHVHLHRPQLPGLWLLRQQLPSLYSTPAAQAQSTVKAAVTEIEYITIEERGVQFTPGRKVAWQQQLFGFRVQPEHVGVCGTDAYADAASPPETAWSYVTNEVQQIQHISSCNHVVIVLHAG